MNDSTFNLPNPPIIEAVLDIECDLPPGQQLAALESPARDFYRSSYPKLKTQFVQEHHFEGKPGEDPKVSFVRHGVQAFQFLQADEKQLVQVRSHGFSFNRLSPYTSLDTLLPEIEKTWHFYVKLASPVQVRLIRLRYINRIEIPMGNDRLELNDYFKVGPRLPIEEKLMLVGFLNQYAAVEVDTKHQVNIVLTMQPIAADKLPVILDNSVAAAESCDPRDWASISSKIQSLRELKNRIFKESVTKKCLDLFQKP